MENTQNNQKPKHLGTFWPLFAIFVVAALLGGIIIGVAYGNMIQDQIYSSNFGSHGTDSRTPASLKTAHGTTPQK